MNPLAIIAIIIGIIAFTLNYSADNNLVSRKRPVKK